MDLVTSLGSGGAQARLAMFEATDSMQLYVGLYGPLSEWHHSSPSGAGRALSQSDGTFVYRGSSESFQATALAAAFHCLHDAAVVADHVLHLGLGTQLTGPCERYLARFDPFATSPDVKAREQSI